jgi:hypothetical protein
MELDLRELHNERELIGRGFPWDYGDDQLPTVDARTLEAIIGVPGSTVNVWINRRIIPGVAIGPKGRARRYKASLVFHLAIMSALARLGYDGWYTSSIAIQAHMRSDARKPGIKLIIEPAPIRKIGDFPSGSRKEHLVQAESVGDLAAEIEKLFPEGPPEALTIVDLSAIWKRVHTALSETALRAAP